MNLLSNRLNLFKGEEEEEKQYIYHRSETKCPRILIFNKFFSHPPEDNESSSIGYETCDK